MVPTEEKEFCNLPEACRWVLFGISPLEEEWVRYLGVDENQWVIPENPSLDKNYQSAARYLCEAVFAHAIHFYESYKSYGEPIYSRSEHLNDNFQEYMQEKISDFQQWYNSLLEYMTNNKLHFSMVELRRECPAGQKHYTVLNKQSNPSGYRLEVEKTVVYLVSPNGPRKQIYRYRKGYLSTIITTAISHPKTYVSKEDVARIYNTDNITIFRTPKNVINTLTKKQNIMPEEKTLICQMFRYENGSFIYESGDDLLRNHPEFYLMP